MVKLLKLAPKDTITSAAFTAAYPTCVLKVPQIPTLQCTSLNSPLAFSVVVNTASIRFANLINSSLAPTAPIPAKMRGLLAEAINPIACSNI